MIKRKTDNLPDNYPMSIAKMISDTFYISTAEIDYGYDIWHPMETTRLVQQHEFAHDPSMWHVWFQMDYIFRYRSTASVSGEITNAASMNKLMLFSPDRQVYINYMGNFASDEMAKYLPEIDYTAGTRHDLHMMARYIVPFHCELENNECLTLAKVNFDAVKNGEKTWDDINVNIRAFSLQYGMRNGDESDAKWVEEEIFANKDDSSYFRNGVKALSFSKDAENAVKVLERIRTEAPKEYVNAVNEFAGQYLLRDEVINYMTASMDDIYASHKDGLSSNIERACTYIHTQDDFVLISSLKSATTAAAGGSLPPALELQFEKCDVRLGFNRNWHTEVGAKITLWLRYFGN